MVHPRIMKIHKNLPGDIPNILFPHWEIAFTNNFFMLATLMVHPRIMKIDKNLPKDIPNIYPYLNVILSLTNCIYK